MKKRKRQFLLKIIHTCALKDQGAFDKGQCLRGEHKVMIWVKDFKKASINCLPPRNRLEEVHTGHDGPDGSKWYGCSLAGDQPSLVPSH